MPTDASPRSKPGARSDLQLLCELRELDPDTACIDALSSAPALQKHGLDDVTGQTCTVWLTTDE